MSEALPSSIKRFVRTLLQFILLGSHGVSALPVGGINFVRSDTTHGILLSIHLPHVMESYWCRPSSCCSGGLGMAFARLLCFSFIGSG
ncbi:hypothetical protein BDV28DRAFT_59033 [Aspergillus coremiiformis]|uniref:Secreted protein n=1 Tax=Aspergillus coremiiformis TaxID=138285 RepID=A0A5N6YVT2_9EURO|nr:hypothetical protein BDV28DRAFT_59033 [Aspergillus coremiiformis]